MHHFTFWTSVIFGINRVSLYKSHKDSGWRIHAYTVYTPIGGKSRCHTSCDLQDHSMQARKSAGEISTLDLKPMRKDTQSPKQEQSVAPQNGPWSKKI